MESDQEVTIVFGKHVACYTLEYVGKDSHMCLLYQSNALLHHNAVTETKTYDLKWFLDANHNDDFTLWW